MRVRGLVVMIVACQVMDPGSIPGERIFVLLLICLGGSCLVCNKTKHDHTHTHNTIFFIESYLKLMPEHKVLELVAAK